MWWLGPLAVIIFVERVIGWPVLFVSGVSIWLTQRQAGWVQLIGMVVWSWWLAVVYALPWWSSLALIGWGWWVMSTADRQWLPLAGKLWLVWIPMIILMWIYQAPVLGWWFLGYHGVMMVGLTAIWHVFQGWRRKGVTDWSARLELLSQPPLTKN